MLANHSRTLIAEESIWPAATDTLNGDLPQLDTALDLELPIGEEEAFEADATTERPALQLTPAVDVATLLSAVSDEKPDVPPTTAEGDTDEAWQARCARCWLKMIWLAPIG